MFVRKVSSSCARVMSCRLSREYCTAALLTSMSRPPHVVYGIFHDLSAELRVLQVASNRKAARPFRPCLRCGVSIIFMLVQVSEGHVGAFPREQDSYRPADPAVATRDQGRLPAQFRGSLIIGCIVLR